MKRVMITGATSMIGVALVEQCIKYKVEVYAIIRPRSSRISRLPKSPLVHMIECEIENLEELVLENLSIDVFYHMAWAYTSKTTRIDPVYQEKNIQYTLNAVKLAKKFGCKKFIGAGSQAEYGGKDEVITPDTWVNPEIAYGVAKYAAGYLSKFLCQQYEMQWIWGRIFSIYGPYDNEGTMIKYAVEELLGGRTPSFSAGTYSWDYLYSEDAGRAFYLLGEKGHSNAVYCIASGERRSLKSYIKELRDTMNPQLEIKFAESLSGEKRFGISADISSLKRDVGFEPQITFSEGIRRMIDFQKNKEIL